MNYLVELTFEVKKIMFRDTDKRYTILNGIIYDYKSEFALNKEMTIKGYIPSVFKGDIFEGVGMFKLDEKRGHYIELLDIPNIKIPENKKALGEFISRRVRGLSIKKGIEIANELGLDALSIIKRDYTMLLKIDGIKEKKAKLIYDQLIKHESFERLALFIQGIGLNTSLAVKIYDKYEEDSLSIIRNNPYCICFDYEIPFLSADKIAKSLNFDKRNNKRLECAITNFVNYRSMNKGDLCTSLNTIIEDLNVFLDKNGVFKENDYSEDEIVETVLSLEQTRTIILENDKNCTYVYKASNNYIENRIANYLENILTEAIMPFCLKDNIDDFIKYYESKYLKLDDKQKDAVYMALLNRISILTGGPGTGKTQTTNTIVQCIKYIRPSARIRLLAPTGKASNRITELTNMGASTIHRGLKLTPFNSHKELKEITDDFVIVDESSMIDAYIFEKLLSVIGENTRIVFVGDVEQLPSVGAGLILRDLIDSKVIPTTKLTKIFRQAENSIIVKNAHKITEGLTTKDKNGVDITNSKKSNFIFWKTYKMEVIKEKILKSVDRLINAYNMSFNDICVLSCTRKGDLGTEELNRILQKKYNPPSPTKAEYEIDALNFFRVGDRVMHNKNNYDLEAFNGDVGIITSIYVVVKNGIEEYRMEIDYPQNTIVYREKDFDELELAYAMTIHKSQGSEFKGVIMPIHSSQQAMLFRNILYTGITRAKEICIIIGEEQTFNNAILNTDNNKRMSRLKEKIKKIPIKKVA